MAQICEITGKRIPHPHNLPEGERPDPKATKRALLKRKISVPELGKGKAKGSVNLKVSEAGLKLIQAAGGFAKYLKEQEDSKLSKKLLQLKHKIHGEPKPDKEEAKEAVKEAPAEPTKVEATEEKQEAKVETKPAEEKSEKPAEAAAAEEAPKSE